MSVGAGSIKRAANAVNSASALNAGDAVNVAGAESIETDKTEEVATRTESIIQKAESRLAARKAAEGKPVSQRGTASASGKNQNFNKTTSGKGQTETKTGTGEKSQIKTSTAEKSQTKTDTKGREQAEAKSDAKGKEQLEDKSDIREGAGVVLDSAAERTASADRTETGKTDEKSGTIENEQAKEYAELEIEKDNEGVINAQNSETSGNRGCIIYGIGQELPIYLL